MPNTIIPPFVLAKAEKVSQKLSGNPPFADLNSISEFSEPLINCLIYLFVSEIISVMANLFLIYFHIISAYPNILDISSDSFSSNFFSSSNITELGVRGVYL